MKKFLRIIAVAMALVCSLFVFCSCGSELDRAVKDADEVIAARNEGSGYPGCEFSAELIYDEEDKCNKYVISVEFGESNKNPDSITDGLRQNIDGYFSDLEDVEVVVKFYIGTKLYKEYRNWELYKTYDL